MEFWGSITFNSLADTIKKSFSADGSKDWKLVGLLFVKDGDPIAEKYLKPFFEVFNSRSGKNTDFYWAGWSQIYNDTPGDPNTGKTYLQFSPPKFVATQADVEENTTWKHSGGADLILFASHRTSENIHLDLGASMCINIRAFEKAGIEPDVLFERIFQFADGYNGNGPIFDLFLSNASRTIQGSVWTFMKSFLSKEAGQDLDQLRLSAVTDISKRRSIGLTTLGPPSTRVSKP